ncbi:hypothetical protein [Hoeflea olei]|uniref:Uncharacterized protein n=1 Tax=Hoeflea olei TaxID=1480615 RepID=A0A1C1YUL1_9HYPH|nr:hypothetical protein [Hoeflea olei]OCW57086.1 hypothetical protein AWJ14_08020 [Hoeflea olei]
MPLQNRVDPSGAILAHPARGEVMGNRGGPLHGIGQTIVRSQRSRSWIVCLTEFKGRRRGLMQPGRYTELFFLDEVTALAAGHRPCFECRRRDALAFADAIGRSRNETRPKAGAIDRLLDGERRLSADDPARRVAAGCIGALPDGAMIRQDTRFFALRGGALLPWSFEGYGLPLGVDALSSAPVYLATPPATVAALRSGYRPIFHSRAPKAET